MLVGLLAPRALEAQGHDPLPLAIAALLVFFTAFNLLEATLPSLASAMAPGTWQNVSQI